LKRAVIKLDIVQLFSVKYMYMYVVSDYMYDVRHMYEKLYDIYIWVLIWM